MTHIEITNRCGAGRTPGSFPVTPHYRIVEKANEFVVRAFVPGVERSALETTVDGETLTVVGRRSQQAPEDWKAVHLETSRADYRLVLKLDRRINRENIQAQLDQGVLTLTLPKAEEVKPRRVEIQV